MIYTEIYPNCRLFSTRNFVCKMFNLNVQKKKLCRKNRKQYLNKKVVHSKQSVCIKKKVIQNKQSVFSEKYNQTFQTTKMYRKLAQIITNLFCVDKKNVCKMYSWFAQIVFSLFLADKKKLSFQTKVFKQQKCTDGLHRLLPFRFLQTKRKQTFQTTKM